MSDSGFSWGKLISNFRSVMGGGAAFMFAMYLLVNNETDSKTHADALDEAIETVQEISASPVMANDGKLVAARGKITATQPVVDIDFNVRSNAVGLRRDVSMYQWVEYEDSEGSGRRRKTTYRYEQEFSSVYYDSSQFHQPAGHTNPPQTLKSKVFMALDAKLGTFDLSDPALIDAAFPADY